MEKCTKDDVNFLREEFFKKTEEFGPRLFHPADIKRVKTDDEYLGRFLRHCENKTAALKMLWDTCAWRHSFGVNDISEENLNQKILKSGSVFPHGEDIDGKTLLIFKSKLHHKNPREFEDQKKCLVYWLERLERERNGDMISLFFDMDGASLGNMDVDYTLYLISLFKSYYPYFLNYIIVFEMAWVLNDAPKTLRKTERAMFTLIKSWLPPEAIKKLVTVNKTTVKDYVKEENRLVSWGGQDSYVFSFTPRGRTPLALADEEEKEEEEKEEEEEDVRARKVRFDEAFLENDKLNESGFDENFAPKLKFKIFPSDNLLFSEDGDDAISSIMMRNEDTRYISYKIKTTSPGKFAVRPSIGVLGPNASEVVKIVLFHGHNLLSLQRDKFLIMYTLVDRPVFSTKEITNFWKVIDEKEVSQWKLRCYMPHSAPRNDSFLVGTSKKVVLGLCSDVAKLSFHSENLKTDLEYIRKQQWAILIMLAILVVMLGLFYFTDPRTEASSQNCWTESSRL